MHHQTAHSGQWTAKHSAGRLARKINCISNSCLVTGKLLQKAPCTGSGLIICTSSVCCKTKGRKKKEDKWQKPLWQVHVTVSTTQIYALTKTVIDAINSCRKPEGRSLNRNQTYDLISIVGRLLPVSQWVLLSSICDVSSGHSHAVPGAKTD